MGAGAAAPARASVLVIEDEEPLRVLLRELLDQAGYDVALAENGARGLEIVREAGPDVVLLDLRIPELDGLEVLDCMVANRQNSLIPVVVVSGESDSDEIVGALQRGAHDYVTKPFDAAVLTARVAAAIRARRRSQELMEAADRLRGEAMTCPLTGLSNRRHGEIELARMISAAARGDGALSALKIDVDDFKKINDTFGHRAGDDALCQIAECLRSRMRSGDLVARWGGDEFVAVLPEANAPGAIRAAEELLATVREHPIQIGGGPEIDVTASIGVAEWRNDQARELLDRADRALYSAKAAGRDRVFLGD